MKHTYNLKPYVIILLLFLTPFKFLGQGIININFNGSTFGHTASIVYIIDGKVNATTYIGRAILFEALGFDTPGQLVTTKEVVTYFNINGRPFASDLTNSFNSLIDLNRRDGIGNITYLETTNQTARAIINEGLRIKELNTNYNFANIGGCNCATLTRQLTSIAEQYDKFVPFVRRVFESTYSPLEHQKFFIEPIIRSFRVEQDGSKPAWGFTYDKSNNFIQGITDSWQNSPAYRSYYPNFDDSFPRQPQDQLIENQVYKGPWPTSTQQKDLKVELKGSNNNEYSYNIDNLFTDGFSTVNSIEFLNKDNVIRNQYFTSSNYGSFNIPTDVTKVKFTGKNSDFIALNLPNFAGVDFTNLKVSGLDVDQATGVVNFILKGDKTTGNGANLATEESFQKKLFLQALTVPTNEWFVSLDTNPTAVATATTAFKQTDMADIFFKADVDLKKDMFTYFYNGQGDIPVMTKWVQILAQNNPTLLNNIVTKGVKIIPNLTIRGVIVPQLANNDQLSGKMNIDDSNYNVEITFPQASLDTGSPALTSQEVSFLSGPNWTIFVNWLNTRRDQVSDLLKNRINAGATTNYKKIKEILPALVAAEWYKTAPRAIVPKKQFAYLINRKLTGTSAPGLNLTPNVAWNQTYWNSQANQLLGTTNVEVVAGNETYYNTYNVTGGVDLDGILLNNTAMNGTKEARNSSAVKTNFINDNGSFVNGGSQKINLPNLVPDNIYLNPTTNPNIPIGTFAQGESITFNFEIKNLGLASATEPFKIQLRNTNLVSGVTGIFNYTISNLLDPNTLLELSVPISNLTASRYRLVVDVDPDFQITESNEFDNNIAVEYIILQNQNCSAGGIVNNSNLSTTTINISDCKVTLGGQITITGNGSVTALHDGVFLKNGFKHVANATSNLKIKSVFAFNNPNSNLFKSSEINNSAKQPDLMIKFKRDDPKNDLKIKVSESKNEMITESDLAKEDRNYLQKSEYSSVYTIEKSTPKDIEVDNVVPDEIIALRNITDNIKTLQINYTDEKVNSAEFWTVAPNPAKEYFEISFNTITDETVSAKLFDINGKEVMNLFTDLKINKGITGKEVNVGSLPKGLYLINLETKSNIHTSKLIIKE